MIFPIGDENVKGGFKPIFSYSFIILNILIFVYQFTLDPALTRQFVHTYGAIPSEILAGEDYSSLFTNMFLHGGILHLLFNMLFLWIFGDNIEAVVGNSKFLLFYIVGGVFASLVHVYLNPSSRIPSIGASGAIAAVMGAYIVMFPQSKIKMFFFFKFIYIPALIFLGFWIAQQLYSGLSDIGPEAAQQGGTAWWAHIGGFVFGVAAGFLFKNMGLVDNERKSQDVMA